MFRPENVTARDLELLSCSLDNALTVQEQLEFKKRLTESPHLNTLLQEQRQLKRALQALPVRKVPHNFTLTRAEAKKAKRGSFLQPVFGWASAISALVLMVVFGSEFIFNNFAVAPAENALVPQATIADSAVPQSYSDLPMGGQIASADDSVYLLNWSVGGKGGGEIGGMGGGSEAGNRASHGVSLNINVAQVDLDAIEFGVTAAEETFPEEVTVPDFEVPPASYGGGEMPSLESEEAPSNELPSEVTREAVERQAPIIFGIDPERLGEVIEIGNEDKPHDQRQATESEYLADEEALYERVSSSMKWTLLAATLLLGVIWLVLKIKK